MKPRNFRIEMRPTKESGTILITSVFYYENIVINEIFIASIIIAKYLRCIHMIFNFNISIFFTFQLSIIAKSGILV